MLTQRKQQRQQGVRKVGEFTGVQNIEHLLTQAGRLCRSQCKVSPWLTLIILYSGILNTSDLCQQFEESHLCISDVG